MKTKNITPSLTTAAVSLLQLACIHEAIAEDYTIDAGILYYSESTNGSANGIQVIKPAVYMSGQLENEHQIALLMTTDVITGASPTGAVTQQSAQVFTSPSGKNYQIDAGSLPVEKDFDEARVSVKADYVMPLNNMNKLLFNAYASREKDYTSLGIGSGILHDFNEKNSTLNVELSVFRDEIYPEGDIPVGFSPMLLSGSAEIESSRDTKSIVDFNAGLTQILSRDSFIKVNLNLNDSNGYLSNPYKVLSVLDDAGVITSSALINTDPDALPYLFEQRPEERLRKSLYTVFIKQFTNDVLHLGYRYYQDDWGIDSNTIDIKYRLALSDKHFLQPHIRLYSQSEADFYRHHLIQGQDVDGSGSVLINNASADYRLAAFSSYVLGVGYTMKINARNEFVARVEYLRETFDDQDGVLPQQQLEDLSATSLQVRYSFFW